MRDILRLDGIDQETKDKLREIARKRFGKPNISMLIRALIAQELTEKRQIKPVINLNSPMVRVEIRLPQSALNEVEKLADAQFSTPHYYIASLVFDKLGAGQLQGDEIEVLRKSNYELSKIGTNLNQIAKAFNQLVLIGGGEKLPEVSKRMVALKKEVSAHISKVLSLLESKTVIWETKGRGSNNQRKNVKGE
jgi:predicted transcriptional regulator